MKERDLFDMRELDDVVHRAPYRAIRNEGCTVRQTIFIDFLEQSRPDDERAVFTERALDLAKDCVDRGYKEITIDSRCITTSLGLFSNPVEI